MSNQIDLNIIYRAVFKLILYKLIIHASSKKISSIDIIAKIIFLCIGTSFQGILKFIFFFLLYTF